MFASELVGTDIIQVGERVWAVNMDPELSFEEYGHMVLKVPGLYRVVFQNKYVRAFLPAVPGLSDWAMLGKAWYHTTERDSHGGHRFDVVLFDAPATGHGLDMLRVPKVIVEVVPPGVLRRDAEAAWRMFTNPEETAVVVVTLPEELPVTETLELLKSVQYELELPLGLLAVNGVMGALFSEPERAALGPIDLLGDTHSAAESAVQAAARRAMQERLQAASLARLFAGTTLPRVILPYLFEDAATPRAIEALSAHF
jgi:anion-transporting  ArsA/GET3 family ATPase